MPEIKPFRGYHFNPTHVNISDVVAPPYDVISPELQRRLYDRHPLNVVRIELGRAEDPYSEASANFHDWVSSGVLVHDEREAIYLLSERFPVRGGATRERIGFIAACRLEDFGKGSVYPHEKTMSAPKEDRFRLFLATKAMFSQIFSLYDDPQRELDPLLKPLLGKTSWLTAELDGVLTRVWKIDDQSLITGLREFIGKQKVFVADGHHRYETALLYRDAMRLRSSAYSGEEPYNFVPMYFTCLDDPGLVILPTHRIIRDLTSFSGKLLLERLEAKFRLRSVDTPDEIERSLSGSADPAFGLILQNKPRYTLLQFNNSPREQETGATALLARLDVNLLHSLILRDILGISEDHQVRRRHLDYEKDSAQAIEAVASGRAQAAFLMNPTRIDQVKSVAEAGLTMPQKSTYFTPKLLSGLVAYSFAEW